VARAARGKVLHCADPDEAQERCEQEVVKLSLDNLMTFPWLAEPVSIGTLRLHGMRFDIRSGALEALDGMACSVRYDASTLPDTNAPHLKPHRRRRTNHGRGSPC
jgi:carbonic anhydrase